MDCPLRDTALVKRAATLGAALLALHAIALPLIADRSRRPELEVAIDPTAPDPRDGARVDPSIAGRVTPPRAGALGPGLHNLRWSAGYRGGFVDSVAAAALAGPFQSPADPPCSVRVRVGQRLLDQIAALARPMIEAELAGVRAWPLGDWESVDDLRLRWVDSGVDVAADRSLFGVDIAAPPAGFLAVELDLRFARGEVPLFIGLVPELFDGKLAVRPFARASIESDSRVVSLVLALLSGDRRATELAEGELAGALIDVLEPPPPVDLGGGATLAVRYCADGGGLRIAGDRFAEIAFAIELKHARGGVLPPRFDIPAPIDREIDGPVSVDIDANGLGALVHQLWAAGVLDRRLAGADLAGSFNRDPDVRSLLTLRVDAVDLAGPPVVAPRPAGFGLAAELALVLRDGDAVTPARLFAAADVEVRGGRPVGRAAVTDLSLTCRPEPRRLRACYSLLVSELVGRSELVTDWLEALLQRTFDELFTGQRLSLEGAPGVLVLERGSASAPAPGRLRVDLDTRIE
jgi:hypothetical protein